jgi:hypothetical protein
MTDAVISSGTQIDSLRQNEYELYLEGQVVRGIFSISGLVAFQADGTYPPIAVSKMVQRDPALPFNVWLREAANGATRTLAIAAIDDGVEVRRWTLHNARILSVSYSAFSPALVDLVEETVQVAFERIETTWYSG